MSIPSFLLIVIINTFLLEYFYLNYCDWFVYMAGCCENYESRNSFAEKRDFVLASRALGVNHWWIIVHHIIPNLMNHVIVAASVSVSNSIMLESSLSFFGVWRFCADSFMGRYAAKCTEFLY